MLLRTFILIGTLLVSGCGIAPWSNYKVSYEEKQTIERVCRNASRPKVCVRDAIDELKLRKYTSDQDIHIKAAAAAEFGENYVQ